MEEPLYFKELVLPAAKNREIRLAQLQDQIDKTVVSAHYLHWVEEREIDTEHWKITYPDGGMISMSEPTFTVLVGNREIQVDSLEEAEEWLWDNHSSSNYLNKADKPDEITCGACTTAIGAHTFDSNCKLQVYTCNHGYNMNQPCEECDR